MTPTTPTRIHNGTRAVPSSPSTPYATAAGRPVNRPIDPLRLIAVKESAWAGIIDALRAAGHNDIRRPNYGTKGPRPAIIVNTFKTRQDGSVDCHVCLMATFRKTDDLSHISLALHPYLVRAHPASSTHDDLPEMSSVTIDALMSSSWVIALPVTVTLQHPLNFFRSADGTAFRISQQTHDVIKSLAYANSSRAISLYCDHPDSAQRDKEEVYPGTAAVPREEVDTTPSASSGSTSSPIPTSFTFNPDAAPFKPRLAPASSLPKEEVVSPTTTPLCVEETLAQVASPASVTEEDPAQTSAPQTPVKLRPSATTITSSTSAPEAEKENRSLTVAADSPAQRFRRRGMRQASKRGAPTDETRPNKRQCTPSVSA